VILDETKTFYVLFADVRGEGGWRYNRKIGENGDVPTGSGTDIAAFNGGTFDDGSLRRMSMVADGKTVKLLLDGVQGAEVKFPFTHVLFEFGSYARANNDTADTTWDNLKIETEGAALLSPNPVTVRAGGSATATVRIPPGLNAQNPVTVRIVSSQPTIAIAQGAVNGVLNLTFPAGATNQQSIEISGVAVGTAQISVEGAISTVSPSTVAVISGPGVQLQDDFASAAINPANWTISNTGFETGTGTFTVAQTGGALEISGTTDTDFWPGASLRTAKTYVATRDLSVSFEIDRTLLEQAGTAGRSGVFITTADRSKFVYFGQNTENNWEVNVNPGSPTGGGTTITAFGEATDALSDTGNHRIKLVANGSTVEVFLDGVSGGVYPFEVTTGIFFEVGGYARSAGDTVRAVFDNAKIEYLLPCVTLSDSTLTLNSDDPGQPVTVTIPKLLNDSAPVTVTITSDKPAIATANGAVNGALTLNFAAGAPNAQTFTVRPTGLGTATFTVATTPQQCVTGQLKADVVAVPQLLFTDSFDTNINDAKWTIDNTAFDPNSPGTTTADSAVTVENGEVRMQVTAETSSWPGFALFTKDTYDAGATTPVIFEVDRTKLDFVLVTGTAANERAGVWVKEPGGNFIFFSDNVAHDGRNYGWRYNKMTGDVDDNPSNEGVNIPAFDGGTFDNQGNHRMKVVANGATVKLYLDNILGTEVPFPFGQDLTFGIGTYVAAATDVVTGRFDNVKISGGSAPVGSTLSIMTVGNSITISWTGTGTLESTDTLSSPNWQPVTPAPTGNTLSLTGPLTGNRFYRVKQ